MTLWISPEIRDDGNSGESHYDSIGKHTPLCGRTFGRLSIGEPWGVSVFPFVIRNSLFDIRHSLSSDGCYCDRVINSQPLRVTKLDAISPNAQGDVRSSLRDDVLAVLHRGCLPRTLWLVDFRRRAEKNLACIHQRFAERWVRMDRLRQVSNFTSHLDCQNSLGDQFARSHPDQTATDHAARLGIDQPFRQAIRPANRLCSTAGCPGIEGCLVFASFALGLFLSSLPRRFRDR